MTDTTLALSRRSFITLINKQLKQGFGFVPLLGAGISVASGIPATPDLHRYLLHCVRILLDRKRVWTPDQTPYPRFSDLNESGCMPPAKAIRKQGSQSSDSPHCDAIAAIGDWRTALLFLSRYTRRPKASNDLRSSDTGSLLRRSPDYDIADSMFLHICANRVPSLSHRILATLYEPLRMHTLLTTNFDDLLEVAFADFGIPLIPFPVHSAAPLPAARNVLQQPSLVKLNGGRHGLRWDYSLDREASPDDQRAVVGYFAGTHIIGHASLGTQGTRLHGRRHFLVAGVSADDSRIRSLITAVLDRVADCHLFWVCYLPNEPKTIGQHFAHPDYGGRVHILRETELGLFFLALHQYICASIPPAGIDWPAIWQFPMPANARTPADYDRSARQHYDITRRRLARALDGASEGENETHCVVIESSRDVLGVSTVVSDAVAERETRYATVLIDLDDYCCCEEFLGGLIDHIARTTGLSDLEPAALQMTPDFAMAELGRYLSMGSRPWLIVLNARDGLGSNVALNTDDTDEWTASDCTQFREMMSRLIDQTCAPITLLLARFTDQDVAPTTKRSSTVVLKANAITYTREGAVERACKWVENQSEAKLPAATFLFSLTLSRCLRYPASLWTWMVSVKKDHKNEDRDVRRMSLAETWLKELTQCSVVHEKQGGMFGMHRGVKALLWQRLRDKYQLTGYVEAELHQCMADWYQKLYASSKDSKTILESIYHRLASARAARSHARIVKDKSTRGLCEAICKSSFTQAINLLLVGKPLLLSRSHPGATDACLNALQREATLAKDSGAVARIENVRFDLNLEYAKFTDAAECLKRRRTRRDDVENAYNVVRLSSAVRSYDEAIQCGTSALSTYGLDVTIRTAIGSGKRGSGARRKMQSPETALSIGAVRQMAAVSMVDWDDRKLMAAVRLSRRLMYAHLLRAQGTLLAGLQGYQESRDEDLDRSRLWYHVACEAMRFLADHRDGFIQVETCRLKTQLGLSLANSGRFTEAHRRLIEADGLLGGLAPYRVRTAGGIIHLRRAEVRILQACYNVVDDADWDRFVDRLGGTTDHTSSKGSSAGNVQREQSSDSEARLALLNDAARSLDRSVSLMSGQRRNVWWWTVYYVLELKLREVWLGLLQRDSSAAGCTWGVRLEERFRRRDLGELVERVNRLVRMDVFIATRVAESVARSVTMLGGDSDRLASIVLRGEKFSIVRRACEILKRAMRERTKWDELRRGRPFLVGALDTQLLEYSKVVVEDVSRLVGGAARS